MRTVLLLALFLVATPRAFATTMRLLPLNELVQRSDVVVVGIASSSSTEWQGGRIVTRTSVQASEQWVGEVSTEFDVLSLGGRVDNLAQRVEGAAQLPQGKPLVLFLRRDTSGSYHPVGMWQGVFLVSNEGTTEQQVQRAPGGAMLLPSRLRVPVPTSLATLRQAVLEAKREQ